MQFTQTGHHDRVSKAFYFSRLALLAKNWVQFNSVGSKVDLPWIYEEKISQKRLNLQDNREKRCAEFEIFPRIDMLISKVEGAREERGELTVK